MNNHKSCRPAVLLAGLCLVLIWSCSDKGTNDVDDDIDNTPPSRVVDLQVTDVGIATMTICWTAPGESDTIGCAAEYSLRGSYDSITDANFDQAVVIDDVPPPLPHGMTQCYSLGSLTPGQSYYFALKTRDQEGNWSALSNCAHATCNTDMVVTFPDSVFERVIRDAIAKPTGDIRRSDLEGLHDIFADDDNVTNLEGVQYCDNLTHIMLIGNHITSLTPLSGMTWLRSLNVGANDITDITPLAGLTTLEQLFVGQNPLTSVSILPGLTGLRSLGVNGVTTANLNPVISMTWLHELNLGSTHLKSLTFLPSFDSLEVLSVNGNAFGNAEIDSLASCPTLRIIDLTFNQVSDLTPLSGLTNLSELYLRYNQIADLQPLVDNPGLGNGDVIHVANNPLSQTAIDTQIPQLEARGVTVFH